MDMAALSQHWATASAEASKHYATAAAEFDRHWAPLDPQLQQLLVLALSPPAGGLAFALVAIMVSRCRCLYRLVAGTATAFAAIFMLGVAAHIVEDMAAAAAVQPAKAGAKAPGTPAFLPEAAVAAAKPYAAQLAAAAWALPAAKVDTAAVLWIAVCCLAGAVAVAVIRRIAGSGATATVFAMLLHTASEGLAVALLSTGAAAASASMSLAAHNAMEGVVVAAAATAGDDQPAGCCAPAKKAAPGKSPAKGKGKKGAAPAAEQPAAKKSGGCAACRRVAIAVLACCVSHCPQWITILAVRLGVKSAVFAKGAAEPALLLDARAQLQGGLKAVVAAAGGPQVADGAVGVVAQCLAALVLLLTTSRTLTAAAQAFALGTVVATVALELVPQTMRHLTAPVAVAVFAAYVGHHTGHLAPYVAQVRRELQF